MSFSWGNLSLKHTVTELQTIEFQKYTKSKTFTSHLNDESLSWGSQRGMDHGQVIKEGAKEDDKR